MIHVASGRRHVTWDIACTLLTTHTFWTWNMWHVSMWHGTLYMGHVAWLMLYANHLFSGPHVACGHWAWYMGHDSCGVGHVAWDR